MARARFCLAFLMSVVATVLVGTVEGATTVKYVNGKLQKTATFDVDKALARAFKLAQDFQMSPVDELPHTDWYQRIDYATQTRFAEMGRLTLADIVDPKAGKPNHATCTAFYVGRDLIATAAHCLTTPLNIESGKLFLFFHHRYDDSADFPIQAKKELVQKKMRIGVEWWYPAEFLRRHGESRVKAGSLDYAFVRLNAPKELQPDAFYSLAEQAVVLAKGRPLSVAGYPGDVVSKATPRAFVPVFVSGTPYLPPAKEVKELLLAHAKAYARTDKPDEKMDDPLVKDHQIVVIADEVGISHGGSGGPWLLKETNVAQEKLEVYGILSWGKQRHFTGELAPFMFSTENKYLRPMASPRITKEMIAIQNHLRANKDGNGFIST